MLPFPNAVKLTFLRIVSERINIHQLSEELEYFFPGIQKSIHPLTDNAMPVDAVYILPGALSKDSLEAICTDYTLAITEVTL